MFVVKDGAGHTVLVNEIAPRVHNSGHWTIDGASVSQFEQHIRAVAGLPLGKPIRHGRIEMTNLIGDEAEDYAEMAGYARRLGSPLRQVGLASRPQNGSCDTGICRIGHMAAFRADRSSRMDFIQGLCYSPATS